MALMRRAFLTFLLSAVLFLLVSAPLVVRAGSEDDDEAEGGVIEGGEVERFDDGIDEFFSIDSLGSGPGVDTVYYFPKNMEKTVIAGESAEIVVGVRNSGDTTMKVTFIRASINLPFDHRVNVQNLTAQEFTNSTIPSGAQASFPYAFTVSKYLQPGGFALVASIYYDIHDKPHKTVFYNGTVEVIEAHGFFSGETLFLITLGFGLVGLAGTWVYGQVQRLSKKTRRTKKVETGTRGVDASASEWLEGTAYTAKKPTSVSMSKSKKKK